MALGTIYLIIIYTPQTDIYTFIKDVEEVMIHVTAANLFRCRLTAVTCGIAIDRRLLEHDYLRRAVIHIGHSPPHWRPDIRWVSNHETPTTDHYIVTLHRLVEGDGASQMVGVIHQDALQSEQIAHHTSEQNRTVFAVTIRIIERLFGKEGTVATPDLVIIFIHQPRLHPVYEHIGRLNLRFARNELPHLAIQLGFHILSHRRISIHRPARKWIVVYRRGGIDIVEIYQIAVYPYLRLHRGIAFGPYGAVVAEIVGQRHRRRDIERQRLLFGESCPAYTQPRTSRFSLVHKRIEIITIDAEERVVINLMTTTKQKIETLTVAPQPHLITTLTIDPSQEEGRGIGVATIVALAHLAEHEQISPVAELMTHTQSEAIADEMVKAAFREHSPSFAHLIL